MFQDEEYLKPMCPQIRLSRRERERERVKEEETEREIEERRK